jgi:hypothetical protein
MVSIELIRTIQADRDRKVAAHERRRFPDTGRRARVNRPHGGR